MRRLVREIYNTQLTYLSRQQKPAKLPATENNANFRSYVSDVILRVLNDDATAEVAVREAKALINEVSGQ